MSFLSDAAWKRIFDAALKYAGTPNVAFGNFSDGDGNNSDGSLIMDNYSGNSDSDSSDHASDADDESESDT